MDGLRHVGAHASEWCLVQNARRCTSDQRLDSGIREQIIEGCTKGRGVVERVLEIDDGLIGVGRSLLGIEERAEGRGGIA